jgi:hypothetical protein
VQGGRAVDPHESATTPKKLGKTVSLLFGSLKNIARRVTDAFRNRHIPDEAFDPDVAASIQIRLDTC